MRGRVLMLAVFGTFQLSAAIASSPSTIDRFGGHRKGAYPAFPTCNDDGSKIQTDAGAAEPYVKLLAEAEEVLGKEERNKFIHNLIPRLREQGLWETAKAAYNSINEAPTNTNDEEMNVAQPSSLVWLALTSASHCKTEDSERILKITEELSTGIADRKTKDALLSYVAFAYARIGLNEKANKIIGHYRDIVETNLLSDDVRLNLAMASAEIGDLQLSAKILGKQASDYPARYLVQIALRQGKFKEASEFLEGPRGNTDNIIARIRALRFLVDSDRLVEATELAERWRMVNTKNPLGTVTLSQIIAAKMARVDPAGAREYLKQHAPLANSNTLAIIAARSGIPAAALSAIDETYVGRFEELWPNVLYGEALFVRVVTETLLEAWSSIAISFSRSGEEARSLDVLDHAAQWCSNSKVVTGPLRVQCEFILRNTYAEIGRPELWWDEKRNQFPKRYEWPDEKKWAWYRAASALDRYGNHEGAVSLLREVITGSRANLLSAFGESLSFEPMWGGSGDFSNVDTQLY